MADSKSIGVAYRDQNLDGTTVGATMTAYGIESSTVHASQLTGNTITGSIITGNTITGNTINGTISGGTFASPTITSPTVSGTITIGANATNLVGFFGTPATVQPTNASEAAAAATGAVSISGTQWGFSTSTQANAIVTLVNQLRADLVGLGVIKGS